MAGGWWLQPHSVSQLHRWPQLATRPAAAVRGARRASALRIARVRWQPGAGIGHVCTRAQRDVSVYRSIDDGRALAARDSASARPNCPTSLPRCVGIRVVRKSTGVVDGCLPVRSAARLPAPLTPATAGPRFPFTASGNGARCSLPLAQAGGSSRAAWVLLHTTVGTKLDATSEAGRSWHPLITAIHWHRAPPQNGAYSFGEPVRSEVDLEPDLSSCALVANAVAIGEHPQ
jgi:hypothetical protein